jgi:hypothetical protein
MDNIMPGHQPEAGIKTESRINHMICAAFCFWVVIFSTTTILTINYYSVFRLFTGFITAAFMAW